MNRSSDLRTSSAPRGRRCRSLATVIAGTVIRTAVAATAICTARPALSALPCGPHPDVAPVNITPQIEGDIDGVGTQIHQNAPNPDLRKFVTAQRQQLRQKYPTIERAALDSYLVWTTCQTIANDHNLPPALGFDEYARLYRLMTEPIDRAAKSE